MPPKTLFRLGLSLLFLALTVYFSTGNWLNSRIFEPLDYPVNLDYRHLQSPPFRINLNETYYVSLDLDNSADDWYQDNRCNYETILYPKWWLYKLSSNSGQPRQLWVSSEQLTHSDGSLSNAFLASPGQYQLEWNIPAAAPCLNPRHPHLSVYTGSSGYREGVGLTQLFCLFLCGTSLALFVVAGEHVARRKFAWGLPLRIFPDMVLRNVTSITKHGPLAPIHGMPHWGLFFGAILWILMFIFMLGPRPSHGLFVNLSSRKATAWTGPAQETLSVYVDPKGRFFVNGEEIARKSLHTKLLDHLSRSTSWSVYFEADSNSLYVDTIYAVDTIQGCGAKFIWITPKMREEWKSQERSLKRIP
jgi:biopolymer transport protein ExbD